MRKLLDTRDWQTQSAAPFKGRMRWAANIGQAWRVATFFFAFFSSGAWRFLPEPPARLSDTSDPFPLESR